MRKVTFILFVILPFIAFGQQTQVADSATYLNDLKNEMQVLWPKNRTINIVFHGHSVPSGYFKTPVVNSLAAYPQLVFQKVKELYTYAVVNEITTAKGGENAEKGALRFDSDVLIYKPDLLFIDYALNDRNIGLERAYKAWDEMIKKALAKGIKVILLTPSPDAKLDNANPENELAKHAAQIRKLAAENNVGLADSYKAFAFLYSDKVELDKYMAQFNHPNELGHELIAKEIMKWLKK
jgi:lysophospholipase L1-like esterase